MKKQKRNDEQQLMFDTQATKALDVALKETSSYWSQIPAIKNKLQRYAQLQEKIKQKRAELVEQEKQRLEKAILSFRQKHNWTTPKSVSDLKGYAKRLKYIFNPDKAILVNMELTNGDHTTFIAYPHKEKFEYEGNMYIIEPEFKYYNHAARMYCLDYHKDFVLPVKRRIPIEMLRKATAMEGITDIENATNPSTLKRFIESEIIEKVMKGQEFEDALKMLKFIGIATVIGVYLHLIIFVVKSGMLQQIKVW